MTEITQDDWEDWMCNPVTEQVFGHIRATVEEKKLSRSTELERLLEYNGKELAEKMKVLIFEGGQITAMEDFLALELEDTANDELKG